PPLHDGVKRQKERQPTRHQENLIPAIDKPCRFACDLYAWSIGIVEDLYMRIPRIAMVQPVVDRIRRARATGPDGPPAGHGIVFVTVDCARLALICRHSKSHFVFNPIPRVLFRAGCPWNTL